LRRKQTIEFPNYRCHEFTCLGPPRQVLAIQSTSVRIKADKIQGAFRPLEFYIEYGGKIGKTRRMFNTFSLLLALFAFHIALHVAAHAMTMAAVMSMLAAMTAMLTTHLTAH